MTNVKDYHNIAMHLSNRFETHVEFNGALMAHTVTDGSHALFAAYVDESTADVERAIKVCRAKLADYYA